MKIKNKILIERKILLRDGEVVATLGRYVPYRLWGEGEGSIVYYARIFNKNTFVVVRDYALRCKDLRQAKEEAKQWIRDESTVVQFWRGIPEEGRLLEENIASCNKSW